MGAETSRLHVVRVERTTEDVTWLVDRLGRAMSGRTRSVLVPAGPEENPVAVLEDVERRVERLGEEVVVVVRTSGSTTGSGRLVGLTAAQLRASIEATDERLGGPATWVLALPPHHVAGLQVVARSVVAGTTPVVVEGHVSPSSLARGVGVARQQDPRGRVHLSLVPTQLADCLADPEATRALAGCAAILVGGAASTPELLAAAREAGLPVVVTYGMSETCGGCVYDGRPLRGVRVVLGEHPDRPAESGRVWISGPMVSEGHLEGDPGVVEVDGTRWLATSDLAHWHGDAKGDPELVVDGRSDDVIISGGLKISAEQVRRAVLATGMVTEAAVVGVEDPRWGQAVTAVVVTSPSWQGLPGLRDAVGTRLPRSHAPRRVVVVRSLPMLASGKPDRVEIRRLAADLD